MCCLRDERSEGPSKRWGNTVCIQVILRSSLWAFPTLPACCTTHLIPGYLTYFKPLHMNHILLTHSNCNQVIFLISPPRSIFPIFSILSMIDFTPSVLPANYRKSNSKITSIMETYSSDHCQVQGPNPISTFSSFSLFTVYNIIIQLRPLKLVQQTSTYKTPRHANVSCSEVSQREILPLVVKKISRYEGQ